MDLNYMLSTDRSKAAKDRIVPYIKDDPEKFAKLFDLFWNGKGLVAQRASWTVSYCAEQYPELIYPYCQEMVDYLQVPGIHDSIKRNILRTFQYIAIPVAVEESLLGICFDLFSDKAEAVAIR